MLTRDEAENLTKEHEGKKPQSIEIFLEYLQITEEEFNNIIINQSIDPWEGKIPVKIGKAPKDYLSWQKKLLDTQ